MKNLQLLTGFEFDECPLLSECSLLSMNVDNGILYGASKSHIFAFECKEDVELIAEVSLKDEGLLGDEHSIVSIQYIPDQFCLSVATSNGELILWNPDNMPPFENVGSVESGISDMSWSHDFELLVLATGKKSMILMTRDFEPITECQLDSSQFGEAELVTVGWGKKETQFHGSEGKAAATKKSECSTCIFDWDDKKPRITWRGDNEYFAVHYVDESLNTRKFKIWTREGKLHSTSAPTSGLAQAISFRTQGNLLACTSFHQNEHKVLFFEKNGLQHGEYILPLSGDNSKVKELSWNMDSSVLAVFCEIGGNATQVQLWTSSNYHWYMKQCLVFSGDDKISCFIWDQECPLKMHLITSSGKHFKYTWTFAINKSLTISDENDVNVGVIDGATLNVTPFARCAVPPPMSAYTLSVPFPIHSAMFGSGERVNDVLVLSIDGSLHWFSHLSAEPMDSVSKYGIATVATDAMGGNGFRIQCPLPTLRAQAKFTVDGSTPLNDHHFMWINANELVACGIFHSKQTLKHYHVSWETGMVVEKASVDVPFGKYVLATDFNAKSRVALIETNDGSCYRLEVDEMILSPWSEMMDGHFAFPRPCQKVSLICYEDKEILLGLTEQFRFFTNGNELAQDCTSYEVHKNFVLLTTHSHILRSLHLKDILTNDLSLSTGESTRTLERGSKLICLIPKETKVILQMPRGNLEVVHPRSLLMEAIQSNIDSVHYKQAFELCRKHRVNMNVLVDHDIVAFVRHVADVIEQLDTTHNINLLMSDLQEEDYTKSMYSSYYKNKQQEKFDSSKVDIVCGAFKEEMEKKDEKKFFLSILMTYLKRSPPNLEGALIKVKRMKDKLHDNLKFTDDALKFLTYMVEVNILYDVALGTYDLKLALMVAEKSQKDPKEYLPYLNELKAMPTDLMKYTIDLKLKRYSKALHHISHLGAEHFDECKNLVIEQKLYAEAMDLYAVDTQEYKEMAFAYAEYLESQRKYDESGMMMFKAGDFDGALKMFEESKNWRFAFCCASNLNFKAIEVVELARKFAGLLIDAHRYLEAAQILEIYADDYEEAAMALISGHNWDEALRIIYKHKRMDLLEVNFKPSLLSSATGFLESIEKTHNDFIMHRDRLMDVRRTKEMQSDLTREGGDARGNCDLYSDTSSVADGESIASSSISTDSRSSRKTGKSSKSRQKLARKKWSLRKGGPTEEFALIEVLHKMATMVHGWKAEMGVLLRTLFMFNEEKKARILQTSLNGVIECIDQAIPQIWTCQNSPSSNDSDMVYGPHMSSNSIVQARTVVDNLTPMPKDPILTTPPLFDKKDSAWKLSILEFNLGS